jgi:hypothetical protein
MTKRVRIYLLIIFLLFGFISLAYYFFGDRQSHYTEEIVSKNSDDLKVELKEFLKQAREISSHFKDNFVSQSPDSFNIKSLNRYFADELTENELVSSIAISGQNKQYIFGRDKDSWLSTYDSNFADTMTTWYRYDLDLKEISSWSDVYGFILPLNAIKNIKNEKHGEHGIWKVYKSKSEERDDLLMNILTVKNKNNEEFLMAFVYNLRLLKRRLKSSVGNANILISIISTSNEVYIPFMDKSQVVDSTGVTLKTQVADLIKNWKQNEKNVPQIFSFTFLNKNYWSKIDTISGSAPVYAFAYTSREADLVQIEEEKDLKIVYLAVLSFFLAIIFGFVFRKEVKDKEAEMKTPLLSKSDIIKILKKGESGNIEFKSSMRWDYREAKVNPQLENVILKTIAAFTNAEGGYLFIGVNDDGKVLGLENDYNTFKKQNLDYFELHIRKIINNQFGIAFSQSMLEIKFPKIESKNICIITVNPAIKPQFLNLKDKQGQQVEKFYVRVGNSSQEITSLEEINEYLNRRF